MTDKLRDLLHDRAAGTDFPASDVDALVRAGDRRVRRRRGAVAGGALAALAVAAALVVPTLRDGDAAPGPSVDPSDGATETLPNGVVSWATSSVILAGDDALDVGHEVRAYVATTHGYVFADPEGTVYSVTDGDVDPIGRTDASDPHLVTDAGSALVGWVDDTSGPAPAFMTFDQSTEDEATFAGGETSDGMDSTADGADPAYFYALDGGTAYWRDARGAVAVDLATQDTEVVDPDAVDGRDILDVEDGVIAFRDGRGVAVGSTRESAVRLPGVTAVEGELSPDGAWFAYAAPVPDIENGGRTEARVIGVDGTTVPLDIPPAVLSFALPFGWLDDDTVGVLSSGPITSRYQSLLGCEVTTGECEIVVEDAGVPRAQIALPNGRLLD
ncbi:hypothetical protein [Nocardioides lijunqiniae]|uniref:hypothetical protein n=1 Tax=Nocardioides lijunqiniae TaxID=2760832 RepID=UPI001878D6FC|nr:hypothetical protein [Nocardioides lijunqiniae]